MAKYLFLVAFLELASMVSAAPAPELVARERLPTKRGLPYNKGPLTKLFQVPGSKISWMYNWGSATPPAADYKYVPMLHRDSQEHTSKWFKDVDDGVKHGVTHVLSFNEPDQCGWACPNLPYHVLDDY